MNLKIYHVIQWCQLDSVEIKLQKAWGQILWTEMDTKNRTFHVSCFILVILSHCQHVKKLSILPSQTETYNYNFKATLYVVTFKHIV